MFSRYKGLCVIDTISLQKILNEEIPITRALGISVDYLTENSIILSAPLANNINHKSTAFGGSLYSVAVLAGWAMIYSILDSLNLHAHIVIHESDIQYLKPVNQDIQASCKIINHSEFDKKIKLFKRKGISRIMLNVEVKNSGQLAVRFTGQYVIHSQGASEKPIFVELFCIFW